MVRRVATLVLACLLAVAAVGCGDDSAAEAPAPEDLRLCSTDRWVTSSTFYSAIPCEDAYEKGFAIAAELNPDGYRDDNNPGPDFTDQCYSIQATIRDEPEPRSYDPDAEDYIRSLAEEVCPADLELITFERADDEPTTTTTIEPTTTTTTIPVTEADLGDGVEGVSVDGIDMIPVPDDTPNVLATDPLTLKVTEVAAVDTVDDPDQPGALIEAPDGGTFLVFTIEATPNEPSDGEYYTASLRTDIPGPQRGQFNVDGQDPSTVHVAIAVDDDTALSLVHVVDYVNTESLDLEPIVALAR